MSGYPYMVCWSAVQFPWVPDPDGDMMPDPRADHDMWFGPFPDVRAAKAFASRLRTTKQHRGYEVGVMYLPDHEFATNALRVDPRRAEQEDDRG